MLELHYFPTSHWSRIVALVLAEAELGFERRIVDITQNASFEPEYIRLNPRGVVPTLIDDGTTVTDGRRIASYIAELVPDKHLCPVGDAAYDEWVVRLHDFPLMLLSYSVWILGMKGEKSAEILADKVDRARRYADAYPDLRGDYLRKAAFFEQFSAELHDPDHVASAKKRCRETLEELAVLVGERGWVAGEYSFADAIATSILWRLLDLPMLDEWNSPGHPLHGYWQRIKARPSFRAVFVDDPLIPEKYRPSSIP